MRRKATPQPDIAMLLVSEFPKKHVSSLLKHFAHAVDDFQRGQWENATAKIGKFIEATLKALYTHAGKTPSAGRSFKADPIINDLGQLPSGSVHDSVRLIIPRACRFVY